MQLLALTHLHIYEGTSKMLELSIRVNSALAAVDFHSFNYQKNSITKSDTLPYN